MLFFLAKVLRVMKYLVTNGHPAFRHGLRKKSQLIAETTSVYVVCLLAICQNDAQ